MFLSRDLPLGLKEGYKRLAAKALLLSAPQLTARFTTTNTRLKVFSSNDHVFQRLRRLRRPRCRRRGQPRSRCGSRLCTSFTLRIALLVVLIVSNEQVTVEFPATCPADHPLNCNGAGGITLCCTVSRPPCRSTAKLYSMPVLQSCT